MIDFVDYLIPQSAATSDIDITSADGNAIPRELLTSIREMDGVREVYGRRLSLIHIYFPRYTVTLSHNRRCHLLHLLCR